MTSVEHSSEALLPFETLLEHLQRQGFHISVEHHLRLRMLLDRVADDCGPSELKTLLCPMFATNAEQQNLFYRTFDTLYPFLSRTEQSEYYPKSPYASQSVAHRAGAVRRWPTLVARALMVFFFVVLVTWKSTTSRDNTKPRPDAGPAVSAGSGSPPIHAPTPSATKPTALRRIRVDGRVQQTKLLIRTDPVYPPNAQRVGVTGMVRFDAVIGGDGAIKNLQLVSGHPLLVESARLAVSQWKYEPTLLNGAPVEVATQIDVDYPISGNLAQQTGSSQPSWYSDQVGLTWIILLGPTLLWLAYEIYRFRRRHLLIRKAHGKTPPYSWPIRTNFAPDIYDPHDLAGVSRVLHRRHHGESLRLDVERTVKASVEALGFPTIRYCKDSRLPEYLFLIDRAGFRDHQAHLYEHLAAALHRQDLYVSIYFFEGDPRICWNRSGTESLYLEELQRTYSGHRLLIFGNGDQLLDAVTGRLVQWHGLLTAWPERAILSPEAPSRWGTREWTLATRFAIAPATLEGLLAIAGYFELPSSMEFRNWDEHGPHGHIESTDLTTSLRRSLGEDNFRWLCACAIYPDLQWDLTLSLGALPSMAPGLVCEKNIVELQRLAWFRSGVMPDNVRRALIPQLDPTTEREVRGAIVRLLESNPAPRGTFADGSHQFQIAYQRYRNSPRDSNARRQLKAAQESMPPDEVTQDYAYLDAAESVIRSHLQLVLPKRLLKVFYPFGVPLFGMLAYARALLVIGVILGSFQLLRVLYGPGTTIAAQIQTSPRDSAVTVYGPVTTTTMTGSGTVGLTLGWKYDVVVSRLGYKALHETAKLPAAHWSFALDPEPIQLHVAASEAAGKLFVDNRPKGELVSGMLDLQIPADGAEHTVVLRNGNTETMSFTFVAKPGETPRVRDLKPKDLFVVSSLATDALVYSGSPVLRANLIGRELQPIPVEGLRLAGLSISDNELDFSNKDIPTTVVDVSNAPVLYVRLNTMTKNALLIVQCNVQAAKLFVDGHEIRSHDAANWREVLSKTGRHFVRVIAAGYDDYTQQVELPNDKPVILQVVLKPIVVSTSATVVVNGGTAGAAVLVDNASVGTLNSDVTMIEIEPGKTHKISFSMEHFEPSETLAFLPRAGMSMIIPGPKLKEWGRIKFEVTPEDAQVTYHRSDQKQFQHARARDMVWVPEGKYEISAEALGAVTQSRSDVPVTPGQVTSVIFHLGAADQRR